MRRGRSPAGQRWLWLLWAAATLLVVASVVQRRTPTAALFLDPAATSSARAWSGFVSELGIMAWVVAATAAACAGFVCSRSRLDGGWARLGLSATVLSAVLAFDDQFLLHSVLVPQLTGIPANACLLAYLGLGAGWVWWNRRAIVRADTGVLIAALLAFGVSQVVDFLLPERSTTGRTLLEEVPKFFGILAWALFFVLLFGRSLGRLADVALAQRGGGRVRRREPTLL